MSFLLITPKADVPSGGHLYNQRIAELTGCAVAPLEAAVFQRVNVVDSLYLNASRLPESFFWLLHWLPEEHVDVLSRARGLIVTSHFMAQRVRSLGFDHVAVCEPGLDARYFERERVERRGHHVLTVANFEARKGHLALLEALARAPEPWTWELIGDTRRDPELTARFQARVGELDLEARVALRGSCSPDEVFAAYARADLFALLPTYEPYGMVFAEAVASGVPVVAPRHGEIPRIVGSAGVLVDDDAAAAISRAFRDRPTRVADFPRWEQTAHQFTEALR